jgi:hypothetical protein
MYTSEERELMLLKMSNAASEFYASATMIGNHPFIEFTGLINEYISLCQQAHLKGVDFTDCSIHTGIKLPMKNHHKLYIQEKLDCIYSGQFNAKI